MDVSACVILNPLRLPASAFKSLKREREYTVFSFPGPGCRQVKAILLHDTSIPDTIISHAGCQGQRQMECTLVSEKKKKNRLSESQVGAITSPFNLPEQQSALACDDKHHLPFQSGKTGSSWKYNTAQELPRNRQTSVASFTCAAKQAEPPCGDKRREARSSVLHQAEEVNRSEARLHYLHEDLPNCAVARFCCHQLRRERIGGSFHI